MIFRYPNSRIKRQTKTRAKLKRVSLRPRLTVFRSNRYTFAQIIDDAKGETLAAVSEKELKDTKGKNKTMKAHLLGEALAKKALKIKIKKVYFDRGSYKYHGRIKALAEAARTGGLEF